MKTAFRPFSLGKTPRILGSATVLVLWVGVASAGRFSTDFNTNPTNELSFAGTLWDGVSLTATGSGAWRPTGGAGEWGATTNGPVYGQSGDGFLQLAFASPSCNSNLASSLCGGVLIDDFDNGLVTEGFTLECDLRLGNGSPAPAGGFSINYLRPNDPVLLALNAGDTLREMNGKISPNGGQFSDDGASGSLSQIEDGCTTGLSLGFHFSDGGDYTIPSKPPAVGEVSAGIKHDGIGLDIRVDGVLLTSISMPNGTTQATEDQYGKAVTDSDPFGSRAAFDSTAIETGPYTGTGCDTNLAWVHLKVDLNSNGVLNVWWKNAQIITNLNTPSFPSAGRLLLAASIGESSANIDVDNLSILTTASDCLLIGNAMATPFSVTIELGDCGDFLVDTNAPIQLLLNGAAVAPVVVTKSGPIVNVTYYTGPANPFPAGSTQFVTVSFQDFYGDPYSETRAAVVPDYLSLPSSLAQANVDTTQPGFNVRTYHVKVPYLGATAGKTWQDTMEPSIRRAEEELFGLLGHNDAVGGGAYIEPRVINYSIATNSQTGFGHFNITTDTNNPSHYQEAAFPGIPQQDPSGTDDPTVDSFACEFTAYINFPEAGLYNMVFNSDDGFRMTAGNPANDQFNATLVSEYDGSRGPSDSGMELFISQAGYYPFRVVYFQGGDGADCEWDVQELYPHAEPLTLVNDSTAADAPVFGQFQAAYRALAAGAKYPAAVTFTDPVVGSGICAPNIPIAAAITDGSDGPINGGSIALYLNGTAVWPQSNKSGNVTTLNYQPAQPLPAGTNSLGIVFTDASNNTYSNRVDFSVANYTVVPASMALPASVATSVGKAGFDIWTIKNAPLAATAFSGTMDYGMDNSVYRSELQVHAYSGNAFARGTVNLLGLTNTADWTVNWRAFGSGPGGSYPEPGVINYNGLPVNAGDYDDGTSSTMPGIPSLTDTNDGDRNGEDNYSVEIQTVLFLGSGYYTMDVNSDDGFSVSVGNPAEWNTMRLILGQADYGKGYSHVDFNFIITTAGYYPFRCLYFAGGGGNNLEWSIETAYPTNGCYILLNDTNATQIGSMTPICVPAFQYPVDNTKGSPYVSAYGPSGRRASRNWTPSNYTHAGFDAPIWAELRDGETAIPTSSVKLSVNGAPVAPTVTKSGSVTSVSYPAPSDGWAAGSTNTVALTFLDRTVAWTFDVENHKNATFFIEAEDFNFGGGQTMAAASTMPYPGGVYAGLSAVEGIDYHSNGDPDYPFYRVGTSPNQPVMENYDLDRGVNELQANYRLGFIGGGEWFNYTRTVPAGAYNIYGGISNGGSVGEADGEYAILQVVDSPSNPTWTNNVGLFDSPNTGGWGFNGHLAPMVDPHGNLASWTSTGTPTTFRYWLPNASTNPIVVAGIETQPKDGNGDWDYMLFMPSYACLCGMPAIFLGQTGGRMVLTYTGVLYSSPTVNGVYTSVVGAASPYTVPATGRQRFYRAGAQ